ncbi:MAG: helix-turn-helix transcriptional regulator [Erysipelotrichaceae bacterium]|nr:helix-turn-helix transcriptional regulator [Erysipelotrichaceae bacterium]
MATKVKVGELIKQARTNAGLTQAQLSVKTGISATDISKAERSEKDLTNEQLKAIAKATGVTQKSLLEAAAGTSSSAKTSTTSMSLTTTEKRLVELYRQADADTKKAAMALLKGTSSSSAAGDMISSLLNNKEIKNILASLIKEGSK